MDLAQNETAYPFIPSLIGQPVFAQTVLENAKIYLLSHKVLLHII